MNCNAQYILAGGWIQNFVGQCSHPNNPKLEILIDVLQSSIQVSSMAKGEEMKEKVEFEG